MLLRAVVRRSDPAYALNCISDEPFVLSPGGVNGVTDGDDVTSPAHIQVRPREGDEAGVSHSMLVPTRDARMNQDSDATGNARSRPQTLLCHHTRARAPSRLLASRPSPASPLSSGRVEGFVHQGSRVNPQHPAGRCYVTAHNVAVEATHFH